MEENNNKVPLYSAIPMNNLNTRIQNVKCGGVASSHIFTCLHNSTAGCLLLQSGN